MDSSNNIEKIMGALVKVSAHIPAGYTCWLIKEYDSIDEVDRICTSDIHHTKRYKVENNYKLNIILKANEQQAT